MAQSSRCSSIWAQCLHCLYSCHWKQSPKERMQTSKIPISPLGTLDGLVPGIAVGHFSTGHICIPTIAPGPTLATLWTASASAQSPQDTAVPHYASCGYWPHGTGNPMAAGVGQLTSVTTGPKILLLLLFFGVTLAIYLAPLFISSPCLMKPRDLPPKPGLVGHRGAPMLAPENTLMSLRKTAECGATVFETDVMVSSDGVPFLMHDEQLSRTTNVASVFPDRITAHSSDFSWPELKRLNAGTWFLQRQPFWEAKKLSGPDWKEAENQTVPALEELLKEAAALNLSIMFDLRRPPRNHTYYDTFVNQTLETVLSTRVPQAMVFWLPDENRSSVQQRAPRMRQIYGHQGANTTERPQFLNLPYQHLPLLDIKALHQDNVSVNLFVVNKSWLFALLWCAGVDSVTTNDCQLLQQMHYPIWLIPPQTYLMMWILTNCISALLLLWTFLLRRRCATERERTGLETSVLLTRMNNRIPKGIHCPGPSNTEAEACLHYP